MGITPEYERLSPQLPQLRFGFGLAGLLFIGQIIWATQRVLQPGSDSAGGIAAAFSVICAFVASAYFLNCVYTYHYVLTQVDGWQHPISPKRAVRFHFIPFFDLYWNYKWPHEIAKFVNWRIGRRRMSGVLVGTLVLLGTLVSFYEASLGLIIVFSAFAYLSRCLREAFAAIPVPEELHVTNGLDTTSVSTNQY
ncbi:MAG TPA: hypothetical protein VGG46_17590 [Terriglobales bacterium]|jgi:hypothetical protein